MEATFGEGDKMTNRWWRVAGALLMNLPSGALYAWSIFVLPLEKEFGWILATYAKDLFSLYLTIGVVLGIGSGFGYASPIPVSSKWFSDRRGLAVGLAVTASRRQGTRRWNR
ncbi:MAG: hypothetical protein ACYC37_05190 [Desulfobacteria bacterium]